MLADGLGIEAEGGGAGGEAHTQRGCQKAGSVAKQKQQLAAMVAYSNTFQFPASLPELKAATHTDSNSIVNSNTTTLGTTEVVSANNTAATAVAANLAAAAQAVQAANAAVSASQVQPVAVAAIPTTAATAYGQAVDLEAFNGRQAMPVRILLNFLLKMPINFVS